LLRPHDITPSSTLFSRLYTRVFPVLLVAICQIVYGGSADCIQHRTVIEFKQRYIQLEALANRFWQGVLVSKYRLHLYRLKVTVAELQEDFPKELYPVYMYALKLDDGVAPP
jgi:hypothetical protein